ncbi:MAG TPA: carbon monoxide dehydrogenase subunit G [Pseudomonadales bacterium]
MEQSGEYRIAASREAVWKALNDPDVLARCLDGCQSMEKVADDRFRARVKARIGPVNATFDADLALENIEPPQSYTINGSVKGGAAGFARGAAHVKLTDEGAATLLQYTVDASIGGKLAQVGSRLIDGAARKMAEDFFARFRDVVEQTDSAEAATAAAGASAPGAALAGSDVPARDAAPEPVAYESSGRWMIWVAVLLALVIAMVLAF